MVIGPGARPTAGPGLDMNHWGWAPYHYGRWVYLQQLLGLVSTQSLLPESELVAPGACRL